MECQIDVGKVPSDGDVISFDDGTTVTIANAVSSIVTHTYVSVGNYTVLLNNASSQFYVGIVVQSILDNIINLLLIKPSVRSHSPVNISILVTRIGQNDTDQFWCPCDYGDGSEVSMNFVDFKIKESLRIDYTYTTSVPTAFLNLTCYNDVSNKTLTDLIILVTPVSNVSLVSPISAYATNSTAFFYVYMNEGSHFNITVDYGDNTIVTYTIYDMSSYSNPILLNHTYSHAGIYSVTAEIFNIISKALVKSKIPIHIQDMIKGLKFSSSAVSAACEEPMVLSGTFETGSSVTFSAVIETPNSLFSIEYNSSVFNFNHAFIDVGNYTVNVTAYNLVNTMSTYCVVVVQERIVSLVLSGNATVLWPPGIGYYSVVLGEFQRQLENVFCTWELNFNRRYLNFFVPTMDQSTPHSLVYTFNRTNIGLNQIKVNCSNMISWQQLSIQVNLILDIPTLGLLTSNTTTTFWNHTSYFTLDITRFAIGTSCFEWSMGDGTPSYVYGEKSCKAFANISKSVFEEISAYPMAVYHNHIFGDMGSFSVIVRAYSTLFDMYTDTRNLSVAVVEWTCVKPNLTVDEKFTNKQKPFENFKSVSLIIATTVGMLCDSGSPRYVWKVLNLDANSGTQFVITNDSSGNMTIASNTLSYGIYEIEVEVHMESPYFDFTNLSDIRHIYLNITRTPLFISVPGGPSMEVPFNENITFDAMNFTSDPDTVDHPENKSGMAFQWWCKRQTETWPFILEPVQMELSVGVSGCFGVGPGLLTSKNGFLNLSTSYMQPLINYTLHLKVVKDVRQSDYEISLYVTLANPPVVQIR